MLRLAIPCCEWSCALLCSIEPIVLFTCYILAVSVLHSLCTINISTLRKCQYLIIHALLIFYYSKVCCGWAPLCLTFSTITLDILMPYFLWNLEWIGCIISNVQVRTTVMISSHLNGWNLWCSPGSGAPTDQGQCWTWCCPGDLSTWLGHQMNQCHEAEPELRTDLSWGKDQRVQIWYNYFYFVFS